jgi:hypothetical protein
LGDAKVAVDTPIATLFARSPGSGRPPGAAQARQAPSHAPTKRPERSERHGRHDAHEAAEAEELDDELPREEFSGNDIPLDELIREYLVLEVPMQPLCSEQCQGIAIPEHLRPPPDIFPGTGAVDPRLAPLQRLRDNVPPTSVPQASTSGGRGLERPTDTKKTSSPTASTLKKPSNRQPKPKPKFNKE